MRGCDVETGFRQGRVEANIVGRGVVRAGLRFGRREGGAGHADGVEHPLLHQIGVGFQQVLAVFGARRHGGGIGPGCVHLVLVGPRLARPRLEGHIRQIFDVTLRRQAREEQNRVGVGQAGGMRQCLAKGD